MNKSVKVSANEAGQVVNISKNNPEYGYIRVSQTKTVFENGWARPRNLSALISGKTSDLKGLGFFAGQELRGVINVIESMEPFNEENPEKDLKVAGATGITCTLGGAPIYRKTFFTSDESVQDVLISHDNGDAVKAAYEALKEAEEKEESADLDS